MQYYNNNSSIDKIKKFSRIDPSVLGSGQTKATSSRNHLESPFKAKRDSVNTIFNETRDDSTPVNVRYSSGATPMYEADIKNL